MRIQPPDFLRFLRLAGFLPLALLPMAGSASAADADAAAFQKSTDAFFEEHCLDCHEKGKTKGGLNLEKADAAMAGPEQTDLWTHIYDRLARGEMPPAKEPQPARAEVERLLAGIKPRLIETDRARRSVVQRRLNRMEYENTVHDLLGIDIDLKHFLPEDQRAGGFDNNGDALALSTEQMQGYLAAALGGCRMRPSLPANGRRQRRGRPMRSRR